MLLTIGPGNRSRPVSGQILGRRALVDTKESMLHMLLHSPFRRLFVVTQKSVGWRAGVASWHPYSVPSGMMHSPRHASRLRDVLLIESQFKVSHVRFGSAKCTGTCESSRQLANAESGRSDEGFSQSTILQSASRDLTTARNGVRSAVWCNVSITRGRRVWNSAGRHCGWACLGAGHATTQNREASSSSHSFVKAEGNWGMRAGRR
ncbi:hypothetical protein M011DRAFT_16909 [Sporormia fimetaria CBS 119925]|uniref:Uncharacterized protein n=1 Tax=Sporormia fimetaria CBS 119925 TaxID=1340428 RepID=A0A6A6VS68_9PLEO|nr:hypothetical protein M011DRAFT_16909 [Sporormia fimetaria CBS 119925]